MTDYQPSVQPAADAAIRPSLTRNSYYNHNSPSINATTRSWVHSQQNTSGPPLPPPLPVPLPTPVQRLRPLPNPHAQQHRRPVLYTVNPSEPLDSEEEEQQRMNNIRLGLQKRGPGKLRKPPATIHISVNNIKDKKPTLLRGLVKGIRNIPNIIGYPGKGVTSKPTGALGADGEGTSTSLTGITNGGALPQYTSNPPTPIVAPIPSHPHHYAHQPMGMQIPMTVPVSGFSPPPEVVRLDDVRRRRPDFRIMPPSINVARSETAHYFPGTTNNTDASSSASNPAEQERTTVMLYSHDHHTPAPTPPLSRQISSKGQQLSHVGSEQIVRATSSHGGSQAPPPIEIPTSITRMGTPASYLSYVSQPAAGPTTVPLHVKRSSSQMRSQLSHQSQSHHQYQPTSPPQHQPSSSSPVEPPEQIQSPVSAHPQPTTDYLKMALSPPHSLQHHTTALTDPTHHSSSGITSFSFDPSFSKTSSPIERFFKTLYYMPWIAYERITVDYLPRKVGRVHAHALSRETSAKGVRDERRRRSGDGRRRETRDRYRDKWRRKQRRTRVDRGDGDAKIASWYKGVPSRSKRTSAELDLLSSDLGLHSSSTTTTGDGAPIGLGLEILPADASSPRPPLAATATAPVKKWDRQQRERKGNVRDKQDRTSHGRHHRHRQDPHNRHRGRQRRRVDSIGSPDNHEEKTLNRSSSPLIPAVYPFYYPPYPYPYPYPYTIPSRSGPHVQSQSKSHSHHLSHPSEIPNEQSQSQSRNRRGPRRRANQGQPSLSHPIFYGPGIPHPGYTAPAHVYQPMIVPSTTTMMAPQVYLLHSSTSHGQLQSSGPVQNGSGGGPEVLPDAVDSGQQ